MIKIRIFFLIGTLCLGASLIVCNSVEKQGKPVNIIIIFADDLGYGDLGCYGHPNINTPHLDKMAQEGIRFTNFYAAACVCTPSRAALLTGRYPIRNVWYNFGPESKNGLPLSEITIADLLKDKGYKTMAVGKWHLGHQKEYLPTSRGFDLFYGLPYSNDMILPWCPWLSEKDKLFLYKDTVTVKEIGYDQDDLTLNYTKKAVEFIRNNKDHPFFLYLAHSMPHLPISTSKEFIGKSRGGLYGDVIETIDWSTGQVLSTLAELEIDDNTIVIFTSDNGPWQNLPDRMLQKGVKRTHSGSAGLLRGYKTTTYEGGFRVPAIIHWPGKINKGIISRQIVTTMDLFTTLVDISGAELPGDRKIDGKNVYPILMGQDTTIIQTFYYLRDNYLHAVRKGAWKLRCRQETGYELFNLDLDPSEMYNVAEDNPDVVKELFNELVAFSHETNAKLEIDSY